MAYKSFLITLIVSFLYTQEGICQNTDCYFCNTPLTDSTIQVHSENYEGLILNSRMVFKNYKYTGINYKKFSGFFNPTIQEIELVEDLFKQQTTYSNEYKRQYFGLLDKKGNKVLVTSFTKFKKKQDFDNLYKSSFSKQLLIIDDYDKNIIYEFSIPKFKALKIKPN